MRVVSIKTLSTSWPWLALECNVYLELVEYMEKVMKGVKVTYLFSSYYVKQQTDKKTELNQCCYQI